MSSDPDPLTHVPGYDRRKPASSLPTVTPGKTAGEPSPEVQLSLKLATPETQLVNRVRSPEYLGDSSLGIRVIYGHSHIYLNLGICLGCKIQVSDWASFVGVIDVHVYFWCHSLVLIFYHIA